MDSIADRQIVAALDGSASDRSVAKLAAAIARQSATALVLVRVVRPTLLPLFTAQLPAPERLAIDARLIERTDGAIQEAHRELCELEGKMRDVHVASLVLVSARPAKRMSEWLRSRPVELVLVAAAPSGGACRRRN